MVKLVVLSDQNIKLFGKRPDGTPTYNIKQCDITGKEVFDDCGEIDSFLQAHGIKFKMKKSLVNQILHPEWQKSRRKRSKKPKPPEGAGYQVVPGNSTVAAHGY